ncbi:MAG: glycosyltransferase [Candidatus Moranbacteria bacterium]|nr:glycosyltransferase [Candidatus Moranbacteria bacterium]
MTEQLNLDEVTIVIPCHNEGGSISILIRSLYNIGFKKILVINDASSDDTCKKASEAGAEVISSSHLLGFSTSLLKGLYRVETKTALICTPDRLLHSYSELVDFVEFGVTGKYSMLLSKSLPGDSRNLSHILKKKFSIFSHEPGFDFVFLDSRLLSLVKDKVATISTYVYFDIIKQVIKNELKMGVYPLNIYSPYTYTLRGKVRRFLRIRRTEPTNYFDYTFPDLEKGRVLREIMIAVVSSVLTTTIGLLIIFLGAYFS